MCRRVYQIATRKISLILLMSGPQKSVNVRANTGLLEPEVPDSVTTQIAEFQRMTVSQLRDKWKELYHGEETRSCNRAYLWRRLAWRVQELAYGGLSERAKARIAELNATDDLRFLPPRKWNPEALAAQAAAPPQERRPIRDARLPSPGSTISRQYHGQEIRVAVLEKGFEWEGRHYWSLSAIAREVTGQRWNGLLFFGLTDRKGGA